MELASLFQSLESHGTFWQQDVSAQAAQTSLTGITTDSRKVGAGTVFVALPGSSTDGHKFIPQAVEQGAAALVVSEERVGRGMVSESLKGSLPIFVAKDPYEAYALLASAWHGYPARGMSLIGVTGTNGKTTVTHLVEQMIQDQGHPVGLIGTLGTRTAGSSNDSGEAYASTGHTTPMAGELQEILAQMKQAGDTHVVLEVSSHALAQHRTTGCDFQVAVFTNLTQDHLDYHQSMEDYCEAKTLLFSQLEPSSGPKTAVINLDDEYAQRFVDACPAGVTQYTYSLTSPDAAIYAHDIEYAITGSVFQVDTPAGTATVRLQLGGEFSVYNALAALGAGLALNIPLEQCIASLEKVSGVRGRFEVVAREPFVIVDYAHTPDGLENVLEAARGVVPEGGRLIAVFGCGGDRDATKRPKMGRIAERLADHLVITSDNPRSEDPQQIITDIIAGIEHFDPKIMTVNADRKQAIHQAIDLATPQDLIVVAGKGHEDYQILADRTIHFDDKEVVQDYMAARTATSASS